jgi:hypothetical protein
MKYIYFVSYNYKTVNGTGFGNAEMTSDEIYSTIDHIRKCESVINASQSNTSGFVCVVNNYILLRTLDAAVSDIAE